ncbi:MAG: cob(I)yrinic acid a,c-diamide adenosyltransferase [Erythrobacter sp.]|uniref:cob(I)yrinic acid a,c-diamide adenosyltransferase n=1 Tax=Erythrobacter sp. TaxID=1042 RepID=UPI003C735D79
MVKLNKIYTRTGDDGTTGLVDGSRTPKNSPRIAAIGAVDEANSAIGAALVPLPRTLPMAEALLRVQNDLFDLGADLATPKGALDGEGFEPGEMVLRVVAAQVEWIEQQIDAFNADLEPLESFVLPGGSEEAARMHVARASVRAAERAVADLAVHEEVNPAGAAYINRLSDLLFVLARCCNQQGRADVTWVPGKNR